MSSHNLSDLKNLVSQVAASVPFQDKPILVAADGSTETIVVSSLDPPDYNDPEVKIDLTNAQLILKDGVEL